MSFIPRFSQVDQISLRSLDRRDLADALLNVIIIDAYFIVSGKKPRIKYGVATASDLLQMATEYFGFVAK